MSYEVRNDGNGETFGVFVDGREVGRYCVVENAEDEALAFWLMLGEVAASVRRELSGVTSETGGGLIDDDFYRPEEDRDDP